MAKKKCVKILSDDWTLWARGLSKKELLQMQRAIENIVQADWGHWVEDEYDGSEPDFELAELKAKHAYIERLLKKARAEEGAEPLTETFADEWGVVQSEWGSLDGVMGSDNVVLAAECARDLAMRLERFAEELLHG